MDLNEFTYIEKFEDKDLAQIHESKLDRLSELVLNGNFDLVYEMVSGLDEAWLFEALLAGAKVQSDGTLKPGKLWKRFKQHSQIMALMAMANLPEGVRVDESLNPNADIAIDINEKNLELLGQLASRLPKLRAASISLEGIHSISWEAAQFLARGKGDLRLHGLTNLSNRAARALAKHEGCLSLGVRSLSDEAAAALADHKGDLFLECLISLSDSPGHIALAQKLAQDRESLSLSALKSIGDAAARALAKNHGNLYLDALEGLSDEAAEALAEHKGVLSLGGIESLSDKAAKALGQHHGYLDLGCLESLSDEAVGALAQHKGDLSLGMQILSDEAAAALAEHKGELSLDSLKVLRKLAAKALSKHEGDLSFINLENLSDEAAMALAEHKGSLSIGVRSLSDAKAAALGKHKGPISFIGITKLSPEGAAQLVNLPWVYLPSRGMLGSSALDVFRKAGTWEDDTWTRNP
jgi:hypothetical protein